MNSLRLPLLYCGQLREYMARSSFFMRSLCKIERAIFFALSVAGR